MPRNVLTPYLPPDHDAFVQAEPPTGRVIVIAPTRAACETIELALHLHLETFLELNFGDHVRDLARGGKGFGIVAGTGTGKTLAIRPIAEEILKTTELKVGVVNREREATPETPSWKVIIVTTGIARRWFEEGDILSTDTLVVDEIHQTSAELELCLALGKRARCRFVWLSATVDPAFYRQYLESADVLQVFAFDPAKAAKVTVVNKRVTQFLDDKFLQTVHKQRRGVACFVPTRKGVEEAAELVGNMAPRINTAFYHGGEPVRVLRPFLEGESRKPYFLSMTAAGQSALNVQGLDTVIIDDRRFFNMIDKGRNVLTQEHLGANELLQMAGRVHGRVEGGRVFILSDRDIQFMDLKPTAPQFQLAGDSERVAMTCAALGVRADELELPVALDRLAYRKAVGLLEERAIIEDGRLTRYGKLVEAMPVERAWAELLVNAEDDLIPYLAVMASVESLHRMTREERDIDGLIVPGSDHLTAYNVYAEAFETAGYMGEVYALPRQLFDEEKFNRWAERRGVLMKAVEDAALGMASIYRAVGLPLPTSMPNAGEVVLRKFQELLAQFMPFALVIDEETADGQEARVSKSSVAGSWGAIAGELRYFADKFGTARAAIEGTQVPPDVIRRYATHGEPELLYEPERRRSPLALRRRVEYYGFELEREIEAIDEFPPELATQARRALAESLARGEAKHHAVKKNHAAVEELREVYRRSGGTTPRLGQKELGDHYEQQLAAQGVMSLEQFRTARLDVAPDDFVAAGERARWLDLPDAVDLRDRTIEIHYDVEETPDGNVGVARLRLPEKVARNLTASEIPTLDRPIRFVVTRGQRGAVRADTLEDLQDLLDRPWTQTEVDASQRAWESQREERKAKKRELRANDHGGSRTSKPVERRGADERRTTGGAADGILREDRAGQRRGKGTGGGRNRPGGGGKGPGGGRNRPGGGGRKGRR